MKTANLIDSIVADTEALIAVRRDIHAHPELAFEEYRTSGMIADKLSASGIPTYRGLGRTGVVGVIKSGNSDRAIGLRADIDALPMTEHNEFPHASMHPGKMHACGHDGHITMLLAAAKCLSERRQFDGTVYLIFQPAEEGGGGANEMIKDGLFERCPMQAIFGAHAWPGLAVGHFSVRNGPVLASSNQFTVKIRGKGTHAAMPHNGIDPLPIACQMVNAFQTIITRNKQPIDTAVVSTTMIRAGEAVNVIPEVCEMRGTVRTFRVETLDMIEQRMRQIAESTCQAFGATCEFEFRRKYPPTINHDRETDFVRTMLRSFVGEDQVQDGEPTMGAEDFSFFLREKPGCYFFVGNGNGVHRVGGHGPGTCMLHSPSYDFNDALIPIGGSMWVRLVEDWFSRSAV